MRDGSLIAAAAILSTGSLSRFSLLGSDGFVAAAPDLSSMIWWPARAATGDGLVLALLLVAGFGALAVVISATAARFGEHVVAAAGVGSVVDTLALPGAGSAPGVSMPSIGVAIPGDRLTELRGHTTPVIGRSRDGRTVLDLRSVDAADDSIVIEALASLSAPSA